MTELDEARKSIPITTITWLEWKERWTAADNIPACLGLLHSVLDTYIWTPTSARDYGSERTCFLLRVADGHADSIGRGTEQGEVILAQKAFKILAGSLFAKRREFTQFELPSDDVQDALVHFWRLKQHGIENMGHAASHARSAAEAYFNDFTKAIWMSSPDSFESRHRLWVIDVLAARQQLDVLLPACHPLSALERFEDEEVLEKLEQIALQHSKTIEEAVFQGFEAAKLLLVVRVALKEMERRKKETQLRHAIEQKKRELADLGAHQ